MVAKDHKDLKENLESQDLKVKMVLQDQWEFKDQKEFKVDQVIQDLKELMVIKDHQETRAHKEILDNQDQ